MKVEVQNGQLTLKQPALLFLVPIGGLFIAIAIFAGIFSASLTRLACDPSACQLTTTYLVLVPPRERTLPLSSIQQARVDSQRSSSSSGSSSTTYRVILDTATGTVPLSNVSTSDRRGKERQANQINQFLANPQGEFELIQNDYWLGLIFFWAFGTPGLILAVVGTTSTTHTLDRLFGKLIVDRQGIWGRRKREHMLSEFTGVSLNKVVTSNRRSRRNSVSYQVDLERLGKRQFLASGRLDDMQTVAEQVQTYMGYASVQDNASAGLAENTNPMELVRLLLTSPAKRAEQIEQYRQQLLVQPQDLAIHRKLVMNLVVSGDRELALQHLQTSRATFTEQGWNAQALEQIERDVNAIPEEMLRRFQKPQ